MFIFILISIEAVILFCAFRIVFGCPYKRVHVSKPPVPDNVLEFAKAQELNAFIKDAVPDKNVIKRHRVARRYKSRIARHHYRRAAGE